MKAPDKIYTDNRGVYAELPIFSQADANVEYICKDALIELIKEESKFWDDGEMIFRGLIDKLNSM